MGDDYVIKDVCSREKRFVRYPRRMLIKRVGQRLARFVRGCSVDPR